MPERGEVVFVDTMVVIEAHRINQWKTLCERYSIRTVEKCVEELATGNQRIRNPIEINIEKLIKNIKPYSVSENDIASLILTTDNAASLDVGEKHLLAFLMKQDPNSLYVCSPDKACMRVGSSIGLLDRFISLEEMLPDSKPQLRLNFTAKWLAGEKTKIRFGSLA